MKIGELLEAIKESPTISPSFNSYDVLMVLLFFSEKKYPIGRYALREQLKLGPGVIRTLLRRLAQLNLIRPVEKKGHILTAEGEETVKEIRKFIAEEKRLRESYLFIIGGENFYGVRLRNAADRISDGQGQRDKAIQVGAGGATTIICKGGKLIIPSIRELNEKEGEMIREAFDVHEGDTIIITSADDDLTAWRGALAAALNLIDHQYE
jgi:predicted transcriptional regulator